MKIVSAIKIFTIVFILLCFAGCINNPGNQRKVAEFTIIQLDPTHGHAAAAQSEQLSGLDTNVYVYAPDLTAVEPYLQQINSFNLRSDNPTKWLEIPYYGQDYLEKMASEKKGNIVVLAGNNRVKIDYIEKSIQAGMNVFSDKPIVINKEGFDRLKRVYELATEKGLVLFDMMTERYSLINRIQKSLMQDSLLFGHLLPGTPDHPSVIESSVHHFYRGGKGTRPAWYFDVQQQGEGIVDVTTHLIDLSFWKSFPDQSIDFNRDVNVLSASHSPVIITKSAFAAATSLPEIPSSLNNYMKDSVLEVYANGSITYCVKGINTRVNVEWRPATPPGGNDLRNACAEGTKCTLIISQEFGQTSPKLCVLKGEKVTDQQFKIVLQNAIGSLQNEYPGISLSGDGNPVQINIPSGLRSSHDPTFKVFLGFLKNKDMPKWEVPNTLAKYYITTTALEMAKQKK